ncbi:hypothetical protein B0H14DRAFT_2564757 [Mycena olivaceomarginata]|nr:hypothetical protein B0H14DRAFT_2564757 [Mycena olivaceomarginata]
MYLKFEARYIESLKVDIFSQTNRWASPWIFTDPVVGNRWRVLAKGSTYRHFARENIAPIGGEEVEEDNNSEDGSPAPKKCKLAALAQEQGGDRVAKGKDFGARWMFFR